MCVSAVIVTTRTSPSAFASSKCITWPMCTRSKAPWQSTIFFPHRSVRRRGSSSKGTILLARRARSAAGSVMAMTQPRVERESGPDRIAAEHLHGVQRELAQIPADQIDLPEDVDAERDDV